ncbi:MAG: PBP1A family penicillin-binding protein [Bacillota bacterium]|jgi:penicillin-binding protein 1A
MSTSKKSLGNVFSQKIKPVLKVYGSTTWKLTKVGIVFLFAMIFGGIGMGTGMVVGALEDVPPFDESLLEHPYLPSYIYDINGDLITEVHDAQNRIPVEMEDVPDNLKNAILAAEDKSFFDHPGFDLRGIARAVYTNLIGGGGQGGSTITQQVAKQVYLTSQKKLSRKIQELYLAVEMERKYNKDDIFEFYINNVTFFGNFAYGVEAASQTYFSKPIQELTLSEAALLAGIPNSPSYYAPSPDNMEPALARRNNVLSMMLNFGFITQEEYDQAINEEIVLNMSESKGWPYPHYTDAIVHTFAPAALMSTGLYENADEAAVAIRRGGLHIYTALDPRIQNIMQDVMSNDKYYPKNTFVYPEGHSRAGRRYPQVAGVFMDAKTGYVYGMVGGREFNSTNKLNRYNSMFQPGSSIKPIVAYGPAFEHGVLSPASTIDDSPTAWPSGSKYYTPENVSRTFKGLVTARTALVHSYNIPAIKAYEKLMQEVGAKAGVEFARKLGLTDYGERNPRNPKAYAQLGTAIGSQEVTPLEMAQAFSGFANRGVTSKPIFVTKILNRDGEEIYSAPITHEVAMSEQTAFLVTDVLRDVVRHGTMSGTGLAKYNVAGKTGTTNDNHDRWRVGYTSKYVFSLWMGNDNKEAVVNGKKVYIPGLSTGKEMTNMFGTIFKQVIGNDIVPLPPRPSGLVQVTVCAKSGLLPTELCTDTVTDWFKTGNVPTEVCDMHVLVPICTVSGLRATEHCPEHVIENRVFLNRPEVEPTDERWKGKKGRLPADYNLRPPDDYCYHHGPSYGFFLEGNTLKWEWTQPQPPGEDEENPPPEFTGFNIYCTRFGETVKLNPQPLPITARSFNVSAHVPGMPYVYKLVLVNSANQELQRHQPISHTRALDVTLVAEPQESYIHLDWNAPSMTAIEGVVLAGYNIYKDGTLVSYIDNPHDTEFDDIGAAIPGTYEYRVKVVYLFKDKPFETPEGAAFTIEIASQDPGDPGDPSGGDPGDPGDPGETGDAGKGISNLGFKPWGFHFLVI